jgi:hypothetical protein
MNSQLFGIVEMAMSFGVVFGLLGWQYWSLREKPPKDDPPKDREP